jgi:hypothetical protein
MRVVEDYQDNDSGKKLSIPHKWGSKSFDYKKQVLIQRKKARQRKLAARQRTRTR